MKKTPLVIAVAISLLIFELLGILGSDNIYAMQEYDPVKEPAFAKAFTAINDGIYPWDMLDRDIRTQQARLKEEKRQKEETMRQKAAGEEQNKDDTNLGRAIATATPAAMNEPKATPSPSPTPSPSATPEPVYPLERIEPQRESTYDEYINHISADIYGDVGVLRAAEYDFKTVDIDYFDDALFIGDSRTVGLRDYTELKDHADFLCETSLTVKKVFTSDFKGKGTVEKALKAKDYGKIYIMVGVNELGTGTTEDFIADYADVIDRLHELEPDAKIIIESIMNIDREKSTSDKIFNNSNIMGRNNAIATLADNSVFFYININEAVCDEDGFLRDDLRGDHLHLLGASNKILVEYLKNHGV